MWTLGQMPHGQPFVNLQGPIGFGLALESTSENNFNLKGIANMVCDQQSHTNLNP